MWRRWDKPRIAGPRAAQPVLAAPEFSGCLPRAPPPGEEDLVYLTEEPVGDREATADSPEAVLEGAHVVRDLGGIVEWHAGSLLHLEEQQVRQRGLRAFDLRREDGFLPDVGVEEEA